MQTKMPAHHLCLRNAKLSCCQVKGDVVLYMAVLGVEVPSEAVWMMCPISTLQKKKGETIAVGGQSYTGRPTALK